jgi:hypothetical protein
MSEWVSECCGAPEIEQSMDIGICTECKEHCDYEDLEEDPTPWCTYCGDAINCDCPPIAENN